MRCGFQDNLSGTEIVLFYRTPITKERVAYANEAYQRRGRKVVNRIVETRIKYGLKILRGIPGGGFRARKSERTGGRWPAIRRRTSLLPGVERAYRKVCVRLGGVSGIAGV